MTDYTTTIHREQPAVSVAAVLAENRKLRVENETLHKWIEQQDEFIERLTAAARKEKT